MNRHRATYHVFNQNIKVLSSEVYILFAKINNGAQLVKLIFLK